MSHNCKAPSPIANTMYSQLQKTLQAAIGTRKRKRRSCDIVHRQLSPAVKKQRCLRRQYQERDKTLYASVLGIPVIGDLILGYSQPKDTPDAIYVVTNSQHLNNTLAWIRSRVVVYKSSMAVTMTVDGNLHSPTDADDDAALVGRDGMKEWYKWGERNRGLNLPCFLYPRYKHAAWYIDGKFIRRLTNEHYDEYFKTERLPP